MKLKELIEKSNQNADFTENYDKNKLLRKKLFIIGGSVAGASLAVVLSCFILWAIFGSSLKSINENTVILIISLVFFVLFAVVFCLAIYFLKQASTLHLEKPQVEPNELQAVEIEDNTEIIETEYKK